MKPYYEHAGITIYHGDCREILPQLDSESVQCVVTSPPYWGLRDYGTATWKGGDPECEHDARTGDLRFSHPISDKQRSNAGSAGSAVPYCLKCGARRIDQQLGLEPTPELYAAKMVEVFREVRRVLRKDGTLWLNMGDSYAANCSYQVPDGKWCDVGNSRESSVPDGLKPKDLVGIPWMLAFALRADGWYLRSDIIWSKPNPMPESVTDRPTKSHEYLFLLTKSERYYYDAEAIKEEASHPSDAPRNRWDTKTYEIPGQKPQKRLGRNKQDDLGKRTYTGFNARWDAREDAGLVSSSRNKRTVWTIATQPFPEAHFATFPEDLIKPCILAGCPAGGVILDPFFGSGTTGIVATRNHCKCIGIELNSDYIEIASKRSSQEVFDFSGVK